MAPDHGMLGCGRYHRSCMSDPSSHDYAGDYAAEAMARKEPPLLPYEAPSAGALGRAAGSGGEIRVGDRERDAVAEQLRFHLSEGRLTLDEFDERLGKALGARTRADLDPLLSDLPPIGQSSAAVSVPAPLVGAGSLAAQDRHAASLRDEATKLWLTNNFMPWAGVNLGLVFIWLIPFFASGSLVFFWPAFPIFIWGANVVTSLVLARTLPEQFLDNPDGRRGGRRRRRRRDLKRRRGDDNSNHNRDDYSDMQGQGRTVAGPPPPAALPTHQDERGYRPLSGRQPEPEYRRYRDTEDR